MANIIEPENPRQIANPNDFASQAREYILLKKSISNLEARQKELHEKIFEKIDLEGLEDSSGNLYIELDQEVEGIRTLQKNRRAKRILDEEVADRIIEETGIGLDVYEMKRVINEDALMAAFYQEQITEAQLDEMFPAKVTWALTMKKK